MLRLLLVVLRATQPTYEHKHHFCVRHVWINRVSNHHTPELLDGAASIQWHRPHSLGDSATRAPRIRPQLYHALGRVALQVPGASGDLGGFTGSNVMTDKELLAKKSVHERLGQHLGN